MRICGTEYQYIMNVFAKLAVFLWTLIACITAQEDYQTVAVTKHNELRGKHQDTEDIVYDADLAQAAEECVEMYVKGTTQPHNCPNIKNGHYGENYGMVGGSNVDEAMAQIIQLWYGESKDYNFDDPASNDFSKTGHFTQVVWKATKKVGCGCEEDTENTRILCSCVYDPPGNVNLPNAYADSVGEAE